ncbi:MAG: AI-2E family transporter [Gemmatimonadaceae bacterium]|nr:AI-2E family transporter [Gemmatimonadaceae bacterium]
MINADAVQRPRLAQVLTAVVGTVLLLWLFGLTAQIFILLFIAVIFSLYLGAVTDFLEERAHVSRNTAFFLALIFTLAAFAGLVWLIVPPVIEQTRGLIMVLPTYITNWEKGLDTFARRFPALRDFWKPGEHKVLLAVYDQVASTAESIVPKLFGIVQVVIEIFAVVVMAIYLTLQPGVYREWLIALFPPIHRDLIRDLLGDLGTTLRAYIVGQLLAMSALALLTAIGLYLLDVPYWLTFGVFTGLVAVIPFFGTLVSTVLPALFVLSGPGGGARAILVIMLGVVIHVLEGNVIQPLVMSHKVDLPPVLTIMAVLIMGKLLGPMGLIVALPTLAVIMVIVRRILINRIYEGKGFRKRTRDKIFVLRVPAPDGGIRVLDPPVLDIIGLREKFEREAAAKTA